jgi:hypothetical protein
VPDSGGPNRHTCWLTTLNADGSPHVTGIGASWVDGSFWFQTGQSTRKGKNLARDASVRAQRGHRGLRLVIEGTASKITDPGTVAAMAARWAQRGMACPSRRSRPRAHCRLQCSFGRSAAMVCVSPHGKEGNRGGDDRARRRRTLAILKRLPLGSIDSILVARCRFLLPSFSVSEDAKPRKAPLEQIGPARSTSHFLWSSWS